MTNDFTSKDYANLHREARNTELQRRADAALWDHTPTGAIGSVILQLRLRGNKADARARFLLIALIFVIVLGIAYYLGLPFLRDTLNGRKLALEDRIASVNAESEKLNKQRSEVQERTIPLLSPAVSRLNSGVNGSLRQHIETKDGYIIYGWDGAITASTDGGNSFAPLPSGVTGSLYQHIETKDGYILYGRNGAITASTDGGKTFAPRSSGVAGTLSQHIVTKDDYILYGSDGAITASTDGGKTFAPLQSGVTGWLRRHLETKDGYILYGRDGAITASTDGGKSFAPRPSGVTGWLEAHIETKDGYILYGEDGAITASTDGGKTFAPRPSGVTGWLRKHIETKDGYILYGRDGAITASTDGGKTFAPLPSGVTVSLSQHIVTKDGYILYGRDGAITASTDGGKTFAPLQSGVTGWLYQHIVTKDGYIIYGRGNAITTSTDGGKTFAPRPSGVTGSLYQHIETKDGYILYGRDGAITVSTDGGKTFAPLPSGVTGSFRQHIETKDGYILYGSGAQIVVYSNRQGLILAAQKPKSTNIEDAKNFDASLKAFFNSLQPHLRSWGPVDKQERLLDQIIAKRAVIDIERDKAFSTLGTLPTGRFRLNKQREDFATFMYNCRSGVDPSAEASENPPALSKPSEVTLACTQAWQATLDRDRQTWWQTVATQFPPGVLLLFLLATLAGLYRYNLRLAGFHHSRADGLELMAMGLDEKAYAALVSMTDTLAADKVEFGKAARPSDQASDIIKSLLTRGGSEP